MLPHLVSLIFLDKFSTVISFFLIQPLEMTQGHFTSILCHPKANYSIWNMPLQYYRRFFSHSDLKPSTSHFIEERLSGIACVIG